MLKLFIKNIPFKRSLTILVINLFFVFILAFIFQITSSEFSFFSILLIGAIIFILIEFLIIFLLLKNQLNLFNNHILNILKDNISDPLLKKKIKSLDDFEREIEQLIRYQNTEINKLKDMETYRKEFLGNVSHELKTPIFIAQSYIETLLDGSLHDNKVNQKHLNKALKNIFRLSDIVKDLELISKLEKNTLILNKTNFDINSLIYEIVDTFELNAREEKIEIIIDIPMDSNCPVYADEEKIEQVLTNLLVNAIKYSKDEGLVKISCKELNNKYLIEIEDNGIGISKEHLERIFERFYRIDKDRSRKKGGTGLGLAIVKHILEAHNQKISVTSILNRGSKFAFTLDKAKSNT